jgi:uncharacterized protein involved in outer membrane biogenesis
MKRFSLKRMLSFTAKIALAVIVILLVSAILLWFFFPKERIGKRITKELSNKLHQDVSMGEFSVGFYPGVNFSAGSMRITDPTTSREILSTSRVRFDLNGMALIKGVVVIESITVASPTINLIRDTNGAWNVGGIVKGLWSGKKKKGGSKKKSWLQFGTIRIDDGTVSIHDALTDQQLSVNKIGATVDVVGKKASIHAATILLGASRYRIKADVAGFSSPSIVGKLSADVLNIDEIVHVIAGLTTSKEPPASPQSSGEKGFSAEVAVEADQMRFGTFTAAAVSTVWKASGSKQAFSPLHMKAFGGELEGMFGLTILENGTSWHIDFTGKEMDLALLFDQLIEGTIKDEAKGLLHAKGTLSGVTFSEREKMWRSLNGELTFEATDGAIKQSPLLNSIVLTMQLPVSVLFAPEVSLVERLQETEKKKGRNLLDTTVHFKKIDSTFHLADGIAHTEDSHFEGKTVDLLFTGDIDLAEKQMDMKVKAATLGPVSLVLPKVPFIGKKLEKAKESTFSLTFSARGPLAKPEVHLSPMDRFKPKGKQ